MVFVYSLDAFLPNRKIVVFNLPVKKLLTTNGEGVSYRSHQIVIKENSRSIKLIGIKFMNQAVLRTGRDPERAVYPVPWLAGDGYCDWLEHDCSNWLGNHQLL